MAALFGCLAVWSALSGRHPFGAVAAFAVALFCKENAIVVPALVVWAWMAGIGRPARRRAAALLGGWLVAAAGWAAVRTIVLAPHTGMRDLAPVFVGLDAVGIRLTAVAALADVARLLAVPVSLRADYSPLERTAVLGPGDARFLAGLAVAVAWGALVALALRRGRRAEALGLGWAAVAFLPVSNLVLPVGVLVAERTLYLPSVGVAIAAGAALAAIPARRAGVAVAILVLTGAARSATRVPVWRDDLRLTESILDDSPGSYRGPARTGGLLQSARQPASALDAYLQATRLFDRDPAVFIAAADAAITTGRPDLADSLLGRARALCPACGGLYRFQAAAARARGDSATASALLGRVPPPGVDP
jgi:hypothetical protein